MSPFVIPFPVIDPIAIEIGPIAVRWYGISYMAGLLLGWYYLRKLVTDSTLWNEKSPLKATDLDDLIIYVTIGVIVGGRLGHVFLYQPQYYITDPIAIFMVWQGGMAFHGGLIGTILAIMIFSARNSVNPLHVGDLVCTAVPIGLFFGRIANFINAELVGKVSEVPWAMIFPESGAVPRHPSQLYEATLEGLLLFFILRYLTHQKLALRHNGLIIGTFMFCYGLFRIFAEIFREGDPVPGLDLGSISAGIIYSVPLVIIGIYFIYRTKSFRVISQ